MRTLRLSTDGLSREGNHSLAHSPALCTLTVLAKVGESSNPVLETLVNLVLFSFSAVSIKKTHRERWASFAPPDQTDRQTSCKVLSLFLEGMAPHM